MRSWLILLPGRVVLDASPIVGIVKCVRHFHCIYHNPEIMKYCTILLVRKVTVLRPFWNFWHIFWTDWFCLPVMALRTLSFVWIDTLWCDVDNFRALVECMNYFYLFSLFLSNVSVIQENPLWRLYLLVLSYLHTYVSKLTLLSDIGDIRTFVLNTLS